MQESTSLPTSSKRAGALQFAWQALLLGLATAAVSTAVIFIKASTEQPYLVAAYRLLLAAFLLSPLFFRDLRQSGEPYTWRQFLWSLVPGLALAAHFTSWVVGARMTLVANASLLVNLTPVVLPFFLWLFYREVVTRWEVVGTIFAVSGAAILSGANFRSGEDSFIGNLICFGSMLALAAYTALGRKNVARFKSLWVYLVPLYMIAGLVSLGAALTVVNPIKAYTLDNLLYMTGLAVIPTVIGHSLINQSLKYFRGQVVGVTILGQVLMASTMAFIFFGEIPTKVFYLAAGFVVTGIMIVLFTSNNGKAKKPE